MVANMAQNSPLASFWQNCDVGSKVRKVGACDDAFNYPLLPPLLQYNSSFTTLEVSRSDLKAPTTTMPSLCL